MIISIVEKILNNSVRLALKNKNFIEQPFIQTVEQKFKLNPRETFPKISGIYAFAIRKPEIQFSSLLKSKSIVSELVILYVGKAKNIHNRLNSHLRGINKAFSNQNGHPEQVGQDDVLESQKKRRIPSKYEKLQNILEERCRDIFLLYWRWDKERSKPFHRYVFNNLRIDQRGAEAILVGLTGVYYGDMNLNRDFVSRSNWVSQSTIKINLSFNSKINSPTNSDSMEYQQDALAAWRNWTNMHVKPLGVHAFETKQDDKFVLKITQLRNRNLIKRSKGMEELIIEASKKTWESYKSFIDEKGEIKFDGIIYMLYSIMDEINKDVTERLTMTNCSDNINIKKERLESEGKEIPNDTIIPIYIGKTETLGRNGGYSGNLRRVHEGKNKSFFARWGNDKARHIGGFSEVLFNSDVTRKKISANYLRWKEIFIEENHHEEIQLRFPIYFWARAWNKTKDQGPLLRLNVTTPMLEGQLITLARALFPEYLANIQ